MDDPVVAQKKPYIVEESPREVAWCACGHSANQPYCDGSHKGTSFSPIIVKIEEAKKVAWCGCKHSNNKPYCDGAHSKL